jgi:hypothetical protein
MQTAARQVTENFAGDGFQLRLGELIAVVNGDVPAALAACSVAFTGTLPPNVRTLDILELERVAQIRSQPPPAPLPPLTAAEVCKCFKWTADDLVRAQSVLAFPRGIRVYSGATTHTLRSADVSIRYEADRVREWAEAVIALTRSVK